MKKTKATRRSKRTVPPSTALPAFVKGKPFVVGAMIAHETETILRAVKSVLPLVDALVIVDSGLASLTRIAIRKEGGPKPVRFFPFTWEDNFAAARNAALDAAHAVGGEWALVVDTDEWLHFERAPSLAVPSGEALRNFLGTQGASAMMVAHSSRTYSQPRVIRVGGKGPRGKYEGRVHEAYASPNPRPTITGLTFCDAPKTPAQARAKFERDLRILREVTKAEPKTQRWWYYLGQTCECLGDEDLWNEGIDAFMRAATGEGWDEEGAWGAYRAAVMRSAPKRQVTDEDRRAALEYVLTGLRRSPGTAELSALAGFLSYQLGRFGNARAWAEMAIALGCAEGIGDALGRVLFRDLPELYEKPFLLAGFALERQDAPAALVESYRRRANRALEKREAIGS